MYSKTTEILIGAFVVMFGALALIYAYGSSGRSQVDGYPLEAVFARSEGIAIGSSVRLSGVEIGRVTDQKLNENFGAVLTLSIRRGIELPTDSSAAILTDGLLGAKYIALTPGGDDDFLQPGQSIQHTQGAVVVEELLAMIINQAKAKRGEKP